MSRSQSRRNPRLEYARADKQRLEDLLGLPKWFLENPDQRREIWLAFVRDPNSNYDPEDAEFFDLSDALWHHRERLWDLVEDAYDNDLVTDEEFYLAESVRQRPRDLRARAEARFTVRSAALECSVCREFVYAAGRCRSCYVFRRKHKRDRTEDEVVARNRRLMARAEIQQERRAARRVLLERDH